jgi:transposase
MWLKYGKIGRLKLFKILKCFCLDLTASQTSAICNINRNTINRHFLIFRKIIHDNQIKQFKQFIGEVEVDESYFGPRRIKGRATKRGRGTHRQPVFGIFERDGRVYTEIIPDCSRKTLRAIIRGKINPSSTLYSDRWSGYDGLVDVGYDKHFRINHKKDEFSDRHGAHINGIEAFWSFTKRRLSKFNGTKKYFQLHLKECEWRWKKKADKLESELRIILKRLSD